MYVVLAQQSYLAVPVFCICYFSHYWTLGKKQLKEWGVCFGSRFGGSRWLWRRRGGRGGSWSTVTVMKQTDVQLALSILLSPGTQPRRSCCLYSGSALPTYLNLSGNNAHWHTQRWVSMVILSPVKLAMKINKHIWLSSIFQASLGYMTYGLKK